MLDHVDPLSSESDGVCQGCEEEDPYCPLQIFHKDKYSKSCVLARKDCGSFLASTEELATTIDKNPLSCIEESLSFGFYVESHS